jgi:DNA-binding transcriptional MerR regulator
VVVASESITAFTVTVDTGTVEAVNEREAIEGPGFRVEELAARTGAPVRTIREYQTWQVLHPPTRIGRVGFYDDSHVRRLEAIARMQERGYSIAAIRDLFQAWDQGAGLHDVLGIGDSLGIPVDEASVELSTDQLRQLLPTIASSPRLLRRAVKVGLLAEEGDRLGTRSPALVQLVADAIRAGLSPTAALDLAETVVSSASQVGAAIATIVATGTSADGAAALEPLVRQGRMLLARAVASHTIDQVGRHLAERATAVPELAALLADVRIGRAARPAGGQAARTTLSSRRA